MTFNEHSKLEGLHAFLGPSRPYWLGDDEEQIITRRVNAYSSDIGTLLHNVARKRIKHRFKLNKQEKRSVLLELLEGGIPPGVVDVLPFDDIFLNLMTYVNDCIGFQMKPEVILYYSPICFGTADAIRFSDRENFLRIHDYKSGTVVKAHMEQLMVYAALFFLEYKKKPENVGMELRIYQANEVLFHNPTADDIRPIMDKIVAFDRIISQLTALEG